MRLDHSLSPGQGIETNPIEMHASSLQNLQVALNLPETNDQTNQQLALLNLIQMGELHGRGPLNLAITIHSINRCTDRLSHFRTILPLWVKP